MRGDGGVFAFFGTGMISFTAGRCKWGSSTERAGLEEEEEEDERAVEELDVDIFSVSVGRTRVLLIW